MTILSRLLVFCIVFTALKTAAAQSETVHPKTDPDMSLTTRLIPRDPDVKTFVTQPLPEKTSTASERQSESGNNSPEKPVVNKKDFMKKVVAEARERTKHSVIYDGSYVVLDYPGGDVAPNTGVCTDVIVRVYRKLGIDLQKEVHEDMTASFSEYPDRWGRSEPDSNIDHRRVQNLMKYFERHGEKLKITQNAEDYEPGDIVTWQLSAGMHIGIIVDEKVPGTNRYKVVHNIGLGPKMDDFLFVRPITGHYRYYGSEHTNDTTVEKPKN